MRVCWWGCAGVVQDVSYKYVEAHTSIRRALCLHVCLSVLIPKMLSPPKNNPCTAYRQCSVEGCDEASELHVFRVLHNLQHTHGLAAISIPEQRNEQRAVNIALLRPSAAQIDLLAVFLYIATGLRLCGKRSCACILRHCV